MHLVYTLATYSCAVLSHGHGRMRAHACMHTHTFTHTHTHTLHLTLLTLASSSGSAIAILVSLFNFLLFFPPWICRPKVWHYDHHWWQRGDCPSGQSRTNRCGKFILPKWIPHLQGEPEPHSLPAALWLLLVCAFSPQPRIIFISFQNRVFDA